MTVEVNRRLLKGYTKYKDDDRTKSLVSDITKYDQQLRLLNIRDHQVERAKLSVLTVLSMLVYRISLLTVMAIGTLPGLILFAPVFIATKRISNRKSKEALAGSSVKLSGRDVLATWKLIVGLAFAPFLYTVYTLLLAYWTYRNRIQGYLPNFVPIWSIIAFGYILFPSITFAALRIGEIGMDIVKSIRPLILCLNPTSAGSLGKLRETREELAARVEELINTLGPTMFPDFDYGEKFMEGIGEEGLDMEAVKQEGRSQRAFALGAWSHVTNEEAERLEDMGGLRKRVLGAE
jgi:glycerol-3-phosphate O-acyltransferase/dihydroxyacetone phosphate acyltransferase